ncbi:MAG: sigma-70 family RNA polymerase sigma factor [Polyangiaceae bacterium]
MKNPSPHVASLLVENHRRFLRFVEQRVASREDAEEILQHAYVKSIERGGALRDSESAEAWFYRLLRNALVDHYRRRGADRRGRERNTQMEWGESQFEPELRSVVCQCVRDLVPTLKSEYAALLSAIDLDGRSIAEVASEQGMTPNNTRVKLHRARVALRKQLERSCGTCATHGCLDCSCGAPGAPGAR